MSLAKLLLSTFFFANLFALSHNSYAMSVCLNARSTNQANSGHAFVTIHANNGDIIETYGLWPLSKHPGSVAINKPGDLPLATLRAGGKFKIPGDSAKMIEDNICRPFDSHSLARIRTEVTSYTTAVGRYSTLSNNCTHFAVRIYNSASGDSFPIVQTPKAVRRIIAKRG